MKRTHIFSLLLRQNTIARYVLSTSLFNTHQYTFIRKGRVIQDAPGEGVVILAKKHLPIYTSSVTSFVDHEAQESVWCEVKNIGGIYQVLGTI